MLQNHFQWRNTVMLPISGMTLSSVPVIVLCWLGALFALILQPQGLFTFLFVVLSCVKLLTFGCNLCALILGGHYSMVWVERDLGDNFVQSSTGPVQPGLGQSQGWDICISVQVLYNYFIWTYDLFVVFWDPPLNVVVFTA